MHVQKNYYTVKGSDSLELNNTELGFTYQETLDERGRVKSLTRFDEKGKDDEFHEYAYNDTGYTIEVIAHGAGTIDFSTYNRKHDRMEKILSSTDTFYFSNDELGNTRKVSQMKSGTIMDIAIIEFNGKGFPVTLRSFEDPQQLVRYVYNDQGLPIEQSRLRINNSEEKLVLKTVYTYEFREN